MHNDYLWVECRYHVQKFYEAHHISTGCYKYVTDSFLKGIFLRGNTTPHDETRNVYISLKNRTSPLTQGDCYIHIPLAHWLLGQWSLQAPVVQFHLDGAVCRWTGNIQMHCKNIQRKTVRDGGTNMNRHHVALYMYSAIITQYICNVAVTWQCTTHWIISALLSEVLSWKHNE